MMQLFQFILFLNCLMVLAVVFSLLEVFEHAIIGL